jgi:molybdopterin guanine dinucleotide-containing S/N-oxide reductase-like protein
MKEKEKITENKKQTGDVTRRDFLVGAGTVVVGGAIGAGLLSSCNGGETQTVVQTTTKTVPTTVTAAATTITETSTTTVSGEGAVTVTTTVNGGGVVPPALEAEETLLRRNRQVYCLDVKNNRVIRQRPLHYDSQYPELDGQQMSFSARGKTFTTPMRTPLGPQSLAYRPWRDSPKRILYPLKRVDWEPGGDPEKINPENRGKSKYKRISWDEATGIIASELTRVAEQYHPSAIGQLIRVSSWGFGLNVQGDGFSIAPFLHYHLLSKYGQTFTERHYTADSHVGGICGAQFAWGVQSSGYEDEKGVFNDIANNSEMLVAWGCDSLSRTFNEIAGTLQGQYYNWFKELGIKRVFICPDLNKGAGIHNDKWIPVLPCTDGALALAIAYIWLTEDTYEKEYVASHVYGFDKWQAYVTGEEDGVAKTPEWASRICGVSTWTIKALAREWAKKVTSISHGFWGHGGGICRGPYGPDTTRLQIYLLGMQGWGGPGVHLLHGVGDPGAEKAPAISSVGGLTRLYTSLYMKFGKTPNSADTDRQFFPENLIHMLPDASTENPVEYWAFETPYIKRTYPMDGFSEIHMVWTGGSHWTYSWGGGNQKLKSLRSPKLECIVNQSIFMEEGSYYADLVLPIMHGFEIGADIQDATGPFHAMIYCKEGLKPLGEAKTDKAAIEMVADKLGILDELTGGLTSDDLVQQGYDNSGWTDQGTYEEFKERGYFCQPVRTDSLYDPPMSLAFYNDPENNPLRTPTGKFEFESSGLAENFPDDKERNPVAHYVPGGPKEEGWTHDESPIGERVKTYPLVLSATVPALAYHGMLYDVPWLREINKTVYYDGYAYARLLMNPQDAAARDIKNKDLIRFYNDRGSVLACAAVEERIAKGAVWIPKGGGDDAIIPESLNRGGNPNSICPVDNNSPHVNGQCTAGYLVEVEKVTGEQMDEWHREYPEAFAREYDPAYGPLFRNWVEEEEK